MPADRSRLPQVGPDPAFTLPAIVRHVLPNGLQVRTIEHDSMPVITFVLQIDGGVSADPRERDGLTALVADMVDEGTGGLNALEVSDALARIGAEYDVDVGADATVFTLTTLTRFAARGASLLASIVVEPSLEQADFTRVRQMRLDRLRQLKDVPQAVAERAFLRLMYPEHPYGHLSIGDSAALQRIVLDEVVSFHAATYRPSRATLIVAGALPHDDLLALCLEAFGQWHDAPDVDGRPESRPVGSTVQVAPAPRLAVIPRDGAAQSELRIGHLSAPRSTPDYASLLVMNAVLGGQFVSRINLKLREEKGYTYGARSGFDWRRGIAPFAVQASVHTAATADAIRESLNEVSGIRGSRPPTPEELSLARASLTRGYPRNFETAQQVARSTAQLALYGLPDSYFEEFVPKVNLVSGSDVISAAERYLEPSRLTVLVVGDYAAISESLLELGLGEPQVMPLEV